MVPVREHKNQNQNQHKNNNQNLDKKQYPNQHVIRTITITTML